MTQSTRTLLIIGGTGFFGKSILDAFARGLLAPWRIGRVIAASRRPALLRAEHPELVGDGVELLELDVMQAEALPRADLIVHAANTSDARRYAADPLAERAVIVGAAEHFATILAAGDHTPRIVYASSGAVYGAQRAEVVEIDEEAPLAGAETLVPYKRDYAEAKREAEAVIAGLGRAHGVPVAVARCFAFVGPYLPRDQHFAIGNFIADGLAGRAVTAMARHPVVRSYMHADDLVRWLLTIADHATPACRTYNVGSDEAVELGALARDVATRFGVAAARSLQATTPIDRYVPSIARAKRELGLTLELDLDGALDATIARLTHELNPVPVRGDYAAADAMTAERR